MCKSTNRHAENCLGIELNGQSLEIVEKFCYVSDTLRATEGAFDIIITRIRSGWCKFRYLVPLLDSRGLPLGAKGSIHYAVHSVALHVYVALCYIEVSLGQLKRTCDQTRE